MNKEGLYVVIKRSQNNSLYLNLFEYGEPYFNFTIKPGRVNTSIIFNMCDIIPYSHDTDAMMFLTAIGMMYHIAKEYTHILMGLINYESKDTILFGIDDSIKTVAFKSNDSFIDSLIMSNLIEDYVPIYLIGNHKGNTIFYESGMQCIFESYIYSDNLQIFNNVR